jgi:hypothetical protein
MALRASAHRSSRMLGRHCVLKSSSPSRMSIMAVSLTGPRSQIKVTSSASLVTRAYCGPCAVLPAECSRRHHGKRAFAGTKRIANCRDDLTSLQYIVTPLKSGGFGAADRDERKNGKFEFGCSRTMTPSLMYSRILPRKNGGNFG